MDFRVIAVRRFRFLPPRLFAILVRAVFDHRLTTLRDPKLFSEMLVVKNLNDRDPLIPLTADKLAVRDYVAEKIGEQYLIPLIQSAESVDEIDFASLPSKCVIKGTHGCDMTLLVTEDRPLNVEEARTKVAKWLRTDFSKDWKEWIYSQIKPRIVIEEFIGGDEPPADYKFYVFRGKVGVVQIHQGRFTNHTTDWFDIDWTPLKVQSVYKPSDTVAPKPDTLDEMLDLASKLGADFDYSRVDLYSVDGKVYFGEITHYPAGGRLVLRPREFDFALGDFWRNGTPLPANLRA